MKTETEKFSYAIYARQASNMYLISNGTFDYDTVHDALAAGIRAAYDLNIVSVLLRIISDDDFSHSIDLRFEHIHAQQRNLETECFLSLDNRLHEVEWHDTV